MENKSNKIFIPLTLDNSTKHFLSTRQTVGLLVIGAVEILLQFFIFALHDANLYRNALGSWWVCIPLDLFLTYILILILRKFFLKEDSLLGIYQVNETDQISDIGFMWDWYDVRDGKIYFGNGIVATVVRLDHGYIFDRPPNHKTIHRDIVERAISDITRRGYSFIYYNREVKDTNLDSLTRTERGLERFKGTEFYDISMQISQHTRRVCMDIATLETEYYVIMAGTIDTIRTLETTTNEFCALMQGGLYLHVKPCKTSEIYDLVQKLTGVRYVSIEDLFNYKFKSGSAKLVKVLQVNKSDSSPKSDISVDSNTYSELEEYQEWLRQARSNQSDSAEGEDILL